MRYEENGDTWLTWDEWIEEQRRRIFREGSARIRKAAQSNVVQFRKPAAKKTEAQRSVFVPRREAF